MIKIVEFLTHLRFRGYVGEGNTNNFIIKLTIIKIGSIVNKFTKIIFTTHSELTVNL